MADAALTLGALGSDLAFSVSFGIARELLDAASEAGVAEDELVAVVLALSVAFAALPRSLRAVIRELRQREVCLVPGLIEFKKPKGESSITGSNASGLAEFFALLVDIAKRISISIAVQLLATNVRTQQPLRAVRIVSLLSVAVFFLFLSATSSIGTNKH